MAKRNRLVTIELIVESETDSETYDCINEILREHLPEYSSNDSGLKDYRFKEMMLTRRDKFYSDNEKDDNKD